MGKIETIPVKFGLDGMNELHNYIRDQVRFLSDSYREYHTTRIPEMRRMYKGLPLEENRDFPWENASNLVVQIIGTFADTLHARIMGSIWEVNPLFAVSSVGEWSKEMDVERMRSTVEEALNTFAHDPSMLDLYRVESLWFMDSIKYGVKVVKVPYVQLVEQEVISWQSNGNNAVHETIIYQGPRPENIEPEDFATYNNVPTLEDSPFKYHRIRLTKMDLEERVVTLGYDKTLVQKIIDSDADDYGSTPQETTINAEGGIASYQNKNAAHWHLFECWFPYFFNGKKYRIISTYHKKSETYLRDIFNFYDGNMEPFESARLGYRVSEFLGYGFAEMLKDYQEEASATHNKRQDNMTVANIQGVRISPQNAKVDSSFKVAPGFIFPGEPGEIEPITFGTQYRSTQPDEELVLKEVADRAGTGPAVSGMGGGTVSKKGQYSAQGTFATMQDGNSRVNTDVMDIRYAHTRLGRKLARIYAQFGIASEQLRAFGTNAPLLQEALTQVRNKKLILPISSATASINRELERQNTLLLSSTLNRHYTAIGQMLQAIGNPAAPPEIKKYLTDAVAGANLIMKQILKAFNYTNTEILIPNPQMQQQPQQPQQQPQMQSPQQLQQGGGANGTEGGAIRNGSSDQPQGGDGANVPNSGMGPVQSVPTANLQQSQ